MRDRPPLTVVVPTRNRPDHLAACVAALRADLGPADEVLVVDSAGTPPLTGDHVLRCDLPGASRARNAGWRAARHDLVAFVDDDVRVLPGWADALVAELTRTDWVTGKVGVPEGQEDRERPVAVTALTERTVLTPASRGAIGASANLGVRREALRAVDGFDESLGPGTWTRAAEDLDLFDRLLAAGHPGVFTPEAAAVHDQWRDRRDLLRLDHGYGIGTGVRLVRLWRRGDRAKVRFVLGQDVWRGGVREALVLLGKRYEFGAALAIARVLGTLRGALLALVRR